MFGVCPFSFPRRQVQEHVPNLHLDPALEARLDYLVYADGS